MSPLFSLVLLGAVVVAQEPHKPARLDLRGTSFRGANLQGANLASTDLRRCDFQRANVTGANFWRADLSGADLRGVAGLTRRQLSSARWDRDNPPKLDTDLNSFRRFFEAGNMQGRSLVGANLWGADLRRFDFVGAKLDNAILIAANLGGASLQRASVAGALFAGADLSGVDLRGVRGFTVAQLVAARWDHDNPPVVDSDLNVVLKKWEKRRLTQVDLSRARLFLADLSKAVLIGANLSRAALIGANLRDAVLRDAKLDGMVWTGADISSADLRGVEGLTNAMLYSARWDPRRPPRLDTAANLQREFFQRKRLQGQDLSRANLWGADLHGGVFEGGSLRNTILIGAKLNNANLIEVDLTGANLTHADLSGADLRTAKGLTIGQFLSARWDADNPPRTSLEFRLFERLWARRDLRGRTITDACLWDASLAGANFQGASLTRVLLIRADLRGASFARASLNGVELLGADISGADFRGAKHLTPKMVLGAVWDPRDPPVFDRHFNVLRTFAERKRLEFDLAGVNLQPADPPGIMGPARDTDKVAKFRLSRPPLLGMDRLIRMLRDGEYGQLFITR